jgi:hypothetical protein
VSFLVEVKSIFVAVMAATYLLSAPVTVVYGVGVGLVRGLKLRSVKEFVFFRIDFFG